MKYLLTEIKLANFKFQNTSQAHVCLLAQFNFMQYLEFPCEEINGFLYSVHHPDQRFREI